MSAYNFDTHTTESWVQLSVDHLGTVIVNSLEGRATAADLVPVVDIATRPETLAAFASTAQCNGVGDGADDVTLSVGDDRPYTRSTGCPGVFPLVDAARALGNLILARARADAAAP
jgi:hypothetical protein